MTKVVVITPVNRYLGFSVSISPIDQFVKAAQKLPDVEVDFIDPQKSYISINKKDVKLVGNNGKVIEGDVYFAFGHNLLDRTMTKYIIKALETAGEKVINGYDALTILDDKALSAIALSKSGLPVAKSVIASARSDSNAIIESIDSDKIIAKTSGFSAGGIGVIPVKPDIDYLAPILWATKMDNRPKVIQNDLYQNNNGPRSVIRAYVVGGKVVGCYTTNGYGIVNCAGLTRETKAQRYIPTEEQLKILMKATEVVKSTGYCRIDAVGEDENFAIIEINPLARIDADSYGFDVAKAILEYAIRLNAK